MQLTATLNKARYVYFRWRFTLSIPVKIAMALGMAGLTGLLAQVRLPLPFSPVPVTGQTFAVLLAAILLGRWWGGTSMAFYVGLGVLGVPWFTGWTSGLSATGGYLFGFILAALFLGHVIDKNIGKFRLITLVGLMLFANYAFIYVPGVIWLGAWWHFVGGQSITLLALLSMGVFPFIIGDVVKAIAAAGVARAASHEPDYRNGI